MELLTGETLEADWVELLLQHNKRPQGTVSAKAPQGPLAEHAPPRDAWPGLAVSFGPARSRASHGHP